MITSFHEAPFLRPFICIIAGVVIFDHIIISNSLLYLLLGALTSIMIVLFHKKKLVFIQGVIIFMSILILGGIRVNIKNEKMPIHFSNNIDTSEYYFELTIKDEPKRGKRYRSVAEVTSIGVAMSEMTSCQGKLLLYFPKGHNEPVQVNQKYLGYGRIQKVTNNTNPHSFDWQGYLRNRGISHQTFIKGGYIQFLGEKSPGRLVAISTKLRTDFQKVLSTYISSEQALGIAYAMILGYKNKLDKELYKSYTDTGAVHTLAVSGLHVGIMVAILGFLLGFLSSTSLYQRLIKSLLLIAGVWFYAILTGMAPAITRASIMFTIMIIDFYWSNNRNMINSLCAAGFIMLLIDPYNIYKAGFQFSFLALAGILIFYPVVYRVIPFIKVKFLRYLWGLIAVSIAAQLTVFPITIYYFHKFPSYFWLSSLIAIPLAFIILSLGVALLLSHYIFPFLTPLFGDLISAFIKFLNVSINTVRDLPLSSNENLWLDKYQIILIYLGILILALMILEQKRLYFFVLGFIATVYVSTFTNSTIRHNHQLEVIIYDVYGGTVIDFIDGRKVMTYANIPREDDSEHFMCANNRISKGIKAKQQFNIHDTWATGRMFYNSGFVLTNESQIVIASEEQLLPIHTPVNYLIVTSTFKGNPYQLLENTNPQVVILDKSMDWNRFYKWKRILKHLKINTINIFNQGATTINLTI